MTHETRVSVTIDVNGQQHTVELEARASLSDLLRDHLDLTGTHIGCDHGVCGACTVLLDGDPVRSCITLAASCDGGSVTTVEALDGPVVDRLRSALRKHHGLQCGFCTPGMLATGCDIVDRLGITGERPGPSPQDVRRELAGNICRCTGYMGLVAAVTEVANDATATKESING